MALAFYMDVHVPAAITDGLRRRGLDVLTSQEDGTRTMSDEELLSRARELSRVLFSMDQDMLRIASQRQSSGEPFAGLIFARLDRLAIGPAIDDLELIAHTYSVDEFQRQVEYIPLA